ncbi:hypothetical protein C8J56DRAFT_801699, partial [Mycena floridula]
DKSFAFDYQSVGKQNYIVLYRPGKGAISIVGPDQKAAVSFGDPGPGLGGFDLSDKADLAFAYDFGHTGKMDHIVFYRPGTGLITIVSSPSMKAVFTSSTGIGGYDIKSPADLRLAFDYAGTGKLDHLVFYRPGAGAIFIIAHNSDNTFSPVYKQGGDTLAGIGGFDLKSPLDRIFAFDFDGKGLLNHLVLYRPGSGNIWIIALQANKTYSTVSKSTTGMAGYDLLSTADQAFSYDFEGSGFLNYIMLYRLGGGAVWIAKHNGDGTFTAVYSKSSSDGSPGTTGIGGFDFMWPTDRAFAYDYKSSGVMNAIAISRSGTGTFFIVARGGSAPSAPAGDVSTSNSAASRTTATSNATVPSAPSAPSKTAVQNSFIPAPSLTDTGNGNGTGSGARKEKPVLWVIGCIGLLLFGL